MVDLGRATPQHLETVVNNIGHCVSFVILHLGTAPAEVVNEYVFGPPTRRPAGASPRQRATWVTPGSRSAPDLRNTSDKSTGRTHFETPAGCRTLFSQSSIAFPLQY